MTPEEEEVQEVETRGATPSSNGFDGEEKLNGIFRFFRKSIRIRF